MISSNENGVQESNMFDCQKRRRTVNGNVRSDKTVDSIPSTATITGKHPKSAMKRWVSSPGEHDRLQVQQKGHAERYDIVIDQLEFCRRSVVEGSTVQNQCVDDSLN